MKHLYWVWALIQLLLPNFLMGPMAQNQASTPPTPVNFFYHHIKISSHDYHQYIAPQLRIMDNEFFSSLESLHPQYVLLSPIKELLENVQEKTLDWQESECDRKPTKGCMQIIKQVTQYFRTLDSLLLLYMQKEPFLPILPPGHQETLLLHQLPAKDWNIDLMERLDELVTLNFQVLHFLSNFLMIYGPGNPISMEKNNLFISLIRQYQFWFEQFLFKGLPFEWQNAFFTVWTNFFKILSTPTPSHLHLKILENSLEDLNFSWNEFHLILSKGRNRPPGEVLAKMGQIQGRWNSILKVILR